MKTYTIPCVWQMYGLMKIKAKSLDEALEKAYMAPLPDGDYLDDSFEIDTEGVGQYNENTNQK